MFFCAQNNVGSNAVGTFLTLDATRGCLLLKNGALVRRCSWSYANLTISQINYSLRQCAIIDPIQLGGDTDLVTIQYLITRDAAQLNSSGMLFAGTFLRDKANRPIPDHVDIIADHGATMFQFSATQTVCGFWFLLTLFF
jgi:hypothetical protein